MRKFLYASVASLALLGASSDAFAGPPGFYGGGNFAAPFPAGPNFSGYNYYASPYGYRTYNTYNYTATPWGWSGYQSQGTFVRPYVNAPLHSVYYDPFARTYRYGTGYRNTPNFYYQFYNYGW
jgi:hypothetical protein